MEVKQVDFTKPFTANGKTYVKHTSLTVDEWKEFELLQANVGFGMDFGNVMNRLKDTYALINKTKFADAAVKLHNLMSGIAEKIEKREHPAMMICTLFLHEKDNRQKWSEDIALEKINDWKEEGIDAACFFQLAAHLVPEFLENLETILNDTSEEKVMEKKKSNTTESN